MEADFIYCMNYAALRMLRSFWNYGLTYFEKYASLQSVIIERQFHRCQTCRQKMENKPEFEYWKETCRPGSVKYHKTDPSHCK